MIDEILHWDECLFLFLNGAGTEFFDSFGSLSLVEICFSFIFIHHLFIDKNMEFLSGRACYLF